MSSNLTHAAAMQSCIGTTLSGSPYLGEISMRAYLQTSGAVFGVIAVAHLLRLLWHWPIELAGQLVPLWASWLGLVLSAALSIWALRLIRAIPRTG